MQLTHKISYFSMEFKLSVTLDLWKVLQANTDYNTAVGRILEPPIIARFVKINVKTYNGYPSLRVELYGCTDGMYSLTSFLSLRRQRCLVVRALDFSVSRKAL